MYETVWNMSKNHSFLYVFIRFPTVSYIYYFHIGILIKIDVWLTEQIKVWEINIWPVLISTIIKMIFHCKDNKDFIKLCNALSSDIIKITLKRVNLFFVQ